MLSYTPDVIVDDCTLCTFCNGRYNDEAYNKYLNGCEKRWKEEKMKNKIMQKPRGKGTMKRKSNSNQDD